MKDISIVSPIRGFFNVLINDKRISARFFQKTKSYEINSRQKELISKVVRSSLFDYLGMFQILKERNNVRADILLSFNRFVDSTTKYILYVENPTALYHYSIRRGETRLGRFNITKYLHKENLAVVFFMSKACEQTFLQLCGDLSTHTIHQTVYPLVRKNKYYSEFGLQQKTFETDLKLLFIVQGKRFVSKGGMEVITAMEKMINSSISLTMITNIDMLSKEIYDRIQNSPNICLMNFDIPSDKLEEIYFKHNILIHPTSDDSFGLTILEAMKAGLPIISTELYAIPEMVQEGFNGFLTKPKFRLFDVNNFPNPIIWNHRKKTIYNSKIIDSKLVDFLCDKVALLDNDRNLLLMLSQNSYHKATTGEFSEEFIINQWNKVIEDK